MSEKKPKFTKKLITSILSIGVAFGSVLVSPIAALAADYTIDCTNGPSGSGLSLGDFDEVAPDYFVADIYLGGIAPVSKTVTVVNCTVGLARNAYPDSYVSAVGGEFIFGASTDYTITVPVGSLGDVWGQMRWVSPATSYIINFYNTADPSDPGPATPTIDTRIVIPGNDASLDGNGGSVPSPAYPDETSGINKLNPGEGVEFTSVEGAAQELNDALYVNGQFYGDGTYLTHPVPFRYEDLLSYANELGADVCADITITYYLYDADEVELASASVTMEADSTNESCSSGSGGSSGSSSGAISSKPVKPDASRVTVTPGTNSLDVAMTYSGPKSSKPTSYKVTVYPGGNSCIAIGSNSHCEILALKTYVQYTVSVEAINTFGSSANYAAPGTYMFTSSGLVSLVAKKTIDKFPGDSPQLLKSLKARIKKFISNHPEINDFTCNGYTAGPVKKSDKVLAKTRASNVCAYIEKIKPSVSTTTIGKTPGLPWGAANRKVVIRGYSAIG